MNDLILLPSHELWQIDPLFNDHSILYVKTHRCGQPAQQHGRRIPLRILSRPTSMRRFLVSACLADITQQIHSLRARGVISPHTSFTIGSDVIALEKSTGILCTPVRNTFVLLFVILVLSSAIGYFIRTCVKSFPSAEVRTVFERMDDATIYIPDLRKKMTSFRQRTVIINNMRF